jgi:hypothetical protein
MCTVLYCTVLYYCHRVSTQLQLTNISYISNIHAFSGIRTRDSSNKAAAESTSLKIIRVNVRRITWSLLCIFSCCSYFIFVGSAIHISVVISNVANQSQSHITTVSQSVMVSSSSWGTWPDLCLHVEYYCIKILAPTLWRECGSVRYRQSLLVVHSSFWLVFSFTIVCTIYYVYYLGHMATVYLVSKFMSYFTSFLL